MGTITPTGVINLLRGVPLDNKYNETLYVASDTTEDAHVSTFLQSSYWDANDPYSHYNNHEYQRVNDGVLRLKAPISAVYNVNYMIFKNLGTNATYPNHWFFAFVNKVEYVNEMAVNIYYEIDVFQTYCLDWTLEPCMVERTHTTTDVIGENTIAEPIDTGKLICQKREVIRGNNSDDYFRNYVVCLWFVDADGSIVPSLTEAGYGFGGIYSGLKCFYQDYGSSGIKNINDVIEALTTAGKTDAMVAVTMMPKFIIDVEADSSGVLYPQGGFSFDTGRPQTGGRYSLDGYVPKNKKLLTAPYTCFKIDVQTDKAVYFYERFGSVHQSTNTYNFNVKASASPNPDVLIMPSSYENASGYNQISNALTMSGFPQCAFATDSFRAWLAQNAGEFYGSIASNIVGMGSGAMAAGLGVAGENPATIISGSTSVLNNAIGLGETLYNGLYQYMKGDVAHGTAGSYSSCGARQRAIIIQHLSVRADYARMIDDFFTRFGYAVGRIQLPNLAARKAFTYIKTNGMSIHGNIPSDDMKKINECFDRGITFFKALANIGNYSVDNTL
jgi:hypothetical protein